MKQQINILFWNIDKNDVRQNLCNLVSEHFIDIIVLAECKLNDFDLLSCLNFEKSNYYPNHPLSHCKKIKIITAFDQNFAAPIFEDDRITIRKILLPDSEPFLLVGLHLIDPMNHDEESRSISASLTTKSINEIITAEEIEKVIVIGDFNMNPFDKGMIKTNGFNAAMSMTEVKKKTKRVQGVDYKYYYNPMWSFFGDIHFEPAGSYYYNKSSYITYQWNMFDQVLLSPEILENFDKSSLEIITEDSTTSFLKNDGTPNRNFSDHLPIKFSIHI